MRDELDVEGHLAQRATEILGAVDAMSAELSGSADGEPMGRVRMSAPVVFGQMFVAPLSAERLARYPRRSQDAWLRTTAKSRSRWRAGTSASRCWRTGSSPPTCFVTPPVRALLDFLVASPSAPNPGGRRRSPGSPPPPIYRRVV